MKSKILVVAVLLTGLVAQVKGQKKAPAAAKAAFAKDHPSVTSPTWETERGNYEANWKQNGADHSALYTAGGKFVASEADIEVDRLPMAARTYIKEHLRTKVKEASENVDDKGTVTYEADVKAKAYVFDQNGKFLKIAEGD